MKTNAKAGERLPSAHLAAMLDAYITTALWSSNDESTEQGGEPLDRNYGREDLAPETLETMTRDVARFAAAHSEAIESWPGAAGRSDDPYYSAGHDLWLNRNGHGAGFWDGDWPEPQASELDAAAKALGSCDLYVGDDGLIYC